MPNQHGHITQDDQPAFENLLCAFAREGTPVTLEVGGISYRRHEDNGEHVFIPLPGKTLNQAYGGETSLGQKKGSIDVSQPENVSADAADVPAPKPRKSSKSS